MAHLRSLLALASLGAVLTGCKPDLASVQITPITTPPLDATVGGTQITVAEGIAVAVDVVGINDEGEEEDNLSATTASDALGWVETSTTDRFIVIGREEGSDTLTFSALNVDGSVDVPVTVTAQP